MGTCKAGVRGGGRAGVGRRCMATGVVDAMEKNEAGFELGEKYGGVEMTTLNIGLFPLSQPSYGGAAEPSQ